MGEFRAKDIGWRAQKKLLSRFGANKSVAKVFIDGTTASVLDNLYRLGRAHEPDNKREAEKVVKNIIKMVIKIGLLYRHDQFSREELSTAEQFRRRFRSTALALVSFREVAFSYDRTFLLQGLGECRALLRQLVQRHLTEKSLLRIDHVFAFFARPDLLDDLLLRNKHPDILNALTQDMHALLDAGQL